ncbi:hypothetical protein RIR_jg13384.t1 [Rhizophagus irregularis DAOM 181602=DAOM 197198]|nr:hypothetical protein RIR_jg13384.t1 [Rhizophagus irregularis DAOM 181602=DAOM 197198]
MVTSRPTGGLCAIENSLDCHEPWCDPGETHCGDKCCSGKCCGNKCYDNYITCCNDVVCGSNQYCCKGQCVSWDVPC